MMKLRDGWKVDVDIDVDNMGIEYLYAPGNDFNGQWYADICNGVIRVYPFGLHPVGMEFETIEEAHDCLIKEGSESPWEVI